MGLRVYARLYSFLAKHVNVINYHMNNVKWRGEHFFSIKVQICTIEEAFLSLVATTTGKRYFFFVSNRIATALPQRAQVFSIVNPLLSSHYGCFLLLVLTVCFYFYLFLLVVP